MSFAAVLALAATVALASAPAGRASTVSPLKLIGSVDFSTLPTSTGSASFAGRANETVDNGEGTDNFKAGSGGSTPPIPDTGTVPTPPATPIVTATPGLQTTFQGLDHYDTRTRDGGNSFSLEPPDQGLCTGNGQVVESVNDVMTIFDTSGNRLTGAVSMNAFFGLPWAINRTTGARGDFLSDPKCYYDTATNRFFLTILQEDPAPSVRAHTLIAVSKTGNAAGGWWLYSLDATDDGLNGTPSNPGCPCFGDQPLIGADRYGFYVSTNEFSNSGFNGAQIYAMSKTALERGTANTVVHLQGGPLAEGISYSVQPATSPNGAQFEKSNGGTEYFLSALQFGPSPSDNRIAVWAMTQTASLNDANPAVRLKQLVIPSENYTQPNPAAQKTGPTPFADLLASITGGPIPESYLNTNDDRMNQVVYVNGNLWSGLNTQYTDTNGSSQSGIAWFEVAPNVTGQRLSATMVNQGYVAPTGENVLFPSIGVTPSGKAVMGMTLSGADYYPSAAYSVFDGTGFGTINIAGAGAGPADGFTGYAPYGGDGVERWGDYSAAVSTPDGTVWIANEYIAQSCTDTQFNADSTCGGTRTLFANWSTRISSVKP
ncbi:MAG TPA: hypothetical protein VKO84_12085 [Gaiellaceae bacterium]|nr:hypothetical protein [Gaiellaceae bacterium]